MKNYAKILKDLEHPCSKCKFAHSPWAGYVQAAGQACNEQDCWYVEWWNRDHHDVLKEMGEEMLAHLFKD